MPKKYRFTVDTGLFRELGELLVGRDSTALMELVKNSYDADATEVRVSASGIESGSGQIEIRDDGVGMTADQFEQGFLTIASRSRSSGSRFSRRYKRRYTGAKGVGRLAAHKLAAVLEVDSLPAKQGRSEVSKADGVCATINWDLIEQHRSLSEVKDGLTVTPRANRSSTGTTIRLSRLRRRWTSNDVLRFLGELETLRLPRLLVDSPAPQIIDSELLFAEAQVATTGSRDPGFALIADGDFSVGDDYWEELGRLMSWVIEIDARESTVQVAVAPTSAHLESRRTSARVVRAQLPHPLPTEGPFFQARIFVREQAVRGAIRTFARRASGVRVYSEGFRVLPYGERTDDWLGLDRDYVSKPRSFEIPLEGSDSDLEQRAQEGYYSVGNPQYYGAVFLTQESSGALEMVISREGFIPNQSFDALVDLVRAAINISVRVRAAVGARDRTIAADEKKHQEDGPPDSEAKPSDPTEEQGLADALASAREIASEIQNSTDTGIEIDPQRIHELSTRTLELARSVDRVRDQQALTRVLASVGSELAAFVHEINGLLSQAQTVRGLLARLGDQPGVSSHAAFRSLDTAVDELVDLLGRQSAYIVDVLGVNGRSRRSPQRLAARLDTVVKSLEPTTSRRHVAIDTRVDDRIRTPSMFPAEVSVILRNLLTNAVKAAGTPGRVVVEAEAVASPKSLLVRVQNTGVRVNLREAEQWFEPFESTTTDVDPVLGQGMGLGLTIVRSTVQDYGGTIQFVAPSRGYATAIEVRLPSGQARRTKTSKPDNV